MVKKKTTPRAKSKTAPKAKPDPEVAVKEPTETVETPLAPTKAKASGKVVDRPYRMTMEEARELVWKEKWPNTRFYLVHTYDHKTKAADPFPVWEFESNGWRVLSEDPSVVRHPGHVLMGLPMKEYNEARKAKQDRDNRVRQTETERKNVGEGVNEYAEVTTTFGEARLGDYLD